MEYSYFSFFFYFHFKKNQPKQKNDNTNKCKAFLDSLNLCHYLLPNKKSLYLLNLGNNYFWRVMRQIYGFSVNPAKNLQRIDPFEKKFF